MRIKEGGLSKMFHSFLLENTDVGWNGCHEYGFHAYLTIT